MALPKERINTSVVVMNVSKNGCKTEGHVWYNQDNPTSFFWDKIMATGNKKKYKAFRIRFILTINGLVKQEVSMGPGS